MLMKNFPVWCEDGLLAPLIFLKLFYWAACLLCSHRTLPKNVRLVFVAAKIKGELYFWTWNFQIIIVFSLLGASFILPTGWLVEGNKERRLHTGEATDIIGKWSSRQMTYCTGKHKMSFHAGLCQCRSFSFAWMDHPLMIYLPFIKAMLRIFSVVMDKTLLNWLLPAEHCGAWELNRKGHATIFHSSSKSAMLSRTKDSELQRSCFKWPTDLDHRVVKDLC